MKCLSIKQPWASLIAHGIKPIENRSWKTNFRGRIYIHASGTSQGSLYELLNEQQLQLVNNHWTAAPPFPNRPTSAIIGEVDIVDCVINHPSIWAEKASFPSDSKPIYNWVLANPVLYEKPILNVKGKFSFWEPDFEIVECIGCSQNFIYEDMQQDNSGENFCPKCAAEMFPLMKAEYDDMFRNGEIEE